jgi:rare lipoprotein A
MRLLRIMAIGGALVITDTVSPEPFKEEKGGKHLGTGQASYYGHEFAGRRTANGERYSPNAMTAAHRTAPFGSRILVTHLGNGRQVTVRINDRGPWKRGRIIDLSYSAAQKIGMHKSGTAQVKLTLVGR